MTSSPAIDGIFYLLSHEEIYMILYAITNYYCHVLLHSTFPKRPLQTKKSSLYAVLICMILLINYVCTASTLSKMPFVLRTDVVAAQLGKEVRERGVSKRSPLSGRKIASPE